MPSAVWFQPPLQPAMSEAIRKSTRFALLDPLRGVAAFVVLVNHVTGAPIGYWAVLVFFVISGYCITAGAERSLSNGVPLKEYLWRRARRIYPPYIASFGLFLATRLAKFAIEGVNDVAHRPWTDWLQTATLTQWISLLDGQTGFPADNHVLFVAAHWSLAYEEQFYLFIAVLLFVAKSRSLEASTTMFTLATILGLAVFPATCIGFFVDYWPVFGIGSLLYFVVTQQRKSTPFAILVGLFAVSLIICAITPYGEVIGRRYIWSDLCVASGVAVLLVVAYPWDTILAQKLPIRLLARLGTISYSLYLIHQFMLTIVARITHPIVLLHPTLHVPAQIAAHVGVAAGFYWLFERPFLNRQVTHSA
jgi:peptidoglycan/LPS O-acetylase OafA/YrhL